MSSRATAGHNTATAAAASPATAGTASKPTNQNQNPSQARSGHPGGRPSTPGAGGHGPFRKRKNHRGGKKKQRRRSFAVVPSGGEEDNDNFEVDPLEPLKDAPQTGPARDNFYGLRERNLSNTSLESQALLDHRDQQPFLRARRPSIATPHASGTSTGHNQQTAAAMFSSFAHHSPTRLRVTNASGLGDSGEDGEEEDDDDRVSWNEGAPLLSQSFHRQQPQRTSSELTSSAAARAAAFGGYGTANNNYDNNAENGSQQRSRPLSRHGSGHSSLRQKFLTPFSGGAAAAAERNSYSINYPPSMPGSPALRPMERSLHLSHGSNINFGDEMLRDELKDSRRSPSRSPSKENLLAPFRRSYHPTDDEHERGHEASGTNGGEEARGDAMGGADASGAGSDPLLDRHRRASVLEAAEADVCFPQERLSEIAEEYPRGESPEREGSDILRSQRGAGRRRRGRKWPDLGILDEWSRFEKEARGEGRRAKKIKEPQLVNGRLRPVHRGWHRAEEDAPYRFTYFNELFQSTIHSSTISELVQPEGGLTFRDLFIPDPPLLSDSSDSEEDDDEERGEDTMVGYDETGGDGNGNAPLGLRGDPTNPMASPPPTVNLQRDPLQVAEALSNAGDSYRGGNRSRGSTSPDKEPGPPSAATANPHQLRSRISSAAMERTLTQTSQDSRRPLSVKSPPRAGTPLSNAVENLRAAAPTAAEGNAVVANIADATHSRDRIAATPAQQQQPAPQHLQKQQFRAAKKKQPHYGERPVWWLDVLSPTEAEMKILSKAFGIHPLTAEDIVMQEAREKVELFQHYYFVSYRSFDQDPNSETFLEPVNMYVVVFREGVLSFHFSMTPHPANVRRRIRQLSDYIILSSDWISYAIIDDITDVFVPLIQNIEDEVDDIDDAILQMHEGAAGDGGDKDKKDKKEKKEDTSAAGQAEAAGNMLRRVGDCRKRVMSLYRLLGNKADVIKGFAKRCNEYWEVAPRSEIGLYLGDIQDHIVTMTSNLSHYEKILARAHGNYLAQINIRMNERQEQTADVLGKLTVLGTIVLPMNIITGLWGMNVWVPGQEFEGDLRWFLVITAGLFGFGMACYWIAKRVYKIV